MDKELEIRRINASNEALFNALKTFNVKEFKLYLKKWQPKKYKEYSTLNDLSQKREMCKSIIELKSIIKDNGLCLKAQKWLENHKEKDTKK